MFIRNHIVLFHNVYNKKSGKSSLLITDHGREMKLLIKYFRHSGVFISIYNVYINLSCYESTITKKKKIEITKTGINIFSPNKSGAYCAHKYYEATFIKFQNSGFYK